MKKDNTENREEEKTEDPVLLFLAEKNKTLQHDYVDGKSGYAEYCGQVASDIAEILLKEGREPEIASVRGKRIKSSTTAANEPLEPVQYQGKVSWGGHTVCICDGLVYDPMIGTPVPIGEYGQKAFGSDVEIKIAVPKDKVKEFIER